MTVKDRILLDLSEISNPTMLTQIFEQIQLIKEHYALHPESNKQAVFKFAGLLNDEEAAEIRGIIDAEFNKIEGDW